MQGLLEHGTNKLTNVTADTFVILCHFTFSGKNVPTHISSVFSKDTWP